MPHSHKKKTLAVKRCLAVGLLAIAAAIGVLFGPSARDCPARVHHARQYARRDDLHRCRTA